jgi:hypothetical protein
VKREEREQREREQPDTHNKSIVAPGAHLPRQKKETLQANTPSLVQQSGTEFARTKEEQAEIMRKKQAAAAEKKAAEAAAAGSSK